MVLEMVRMKFHLKDNLVSLKFEIVLKEEISEKIKAKE
jgi:hypothetical protein